MRGQVGNWANADGSIVLGISREMMTWIDAQGCDRRFLVEVSSDRRVTLSPDPNGIRVTSAGSKTMLPYMWKSGATGSVIQADLPIFGLLEVEFREEGASLVTDIPERDYELPWPHLDAESTTYDPAEVARETLQARLNSLVASGLSTFPMPNRMPTYLQRMLGKGVWVECVATAKQLAGVN